MLNSFLLADASPFLTGLLCGLLAVALLAGGIMIGFALAKRSQPPSEKVDSSQVMKIVDGLSHWTNGMSTEVSQHRDEVDRLLRQFDGNAGGEPHERLLAEIRKANEGLRDRLERAEATLQEQAEEISDYVSEARSDPLTGLPNRRRFDDELDRRLAELKRHETPFSLLMLDIDHFKKFNDDHGHLAGDEVLKTVARVLKQASRQTDLVTRYGGEEFAVVMPNSTRLGACQAAERVRRSIECQTVQYEDKRLSVTASVGVALADGSVSNDKIIKRADDALYASKESGRNLASYHDGQSISPVADQLGPKSRVPEKHDFAAVCDDLKRKLEQATSDS